MSARFVQMTTPVMDLAALMKQATNDNEALSTRLKYALQMRRVISTLDSDEVVRVMTDEHYLVVKLADALLHTAYFPLQQLFFMSLAGLLNVLNSTVGEQAAAALQRFHGNLKQLDAVLLSILPLEDVIDAVRLCYNCICYGLTFSYAMPLVQQMPVTVDQWVDFGGLVATFYHQQPRETILYNIPYTCVEGLEFDEANCVAYIFAKRVLGLDGIRLVVFSVEPAIEKMRQKIVRAVESASKALYPSIGAKDLSLPEKVTETTMAGMNAATKDLSATERLVETTVFHLSTGSTGLPPRPENVTEATMLSSNTRAKSLSSPRKVVETDTIPESVYEEDTSMDFWEPPVMVSDDESSFHPVRQAASSSKDVGETLERRLEQTKERLLRDQATVFKASTERLCIANSMPTDTFSGTSATHLALNDKVRKRLYGVQLASDELQQQRLLHIPYADFATEKVLTEMKAECIKNLKMSMGYVEETSVEVKPKPKPKLHR
ncbi:hypothetical protein BBJ28_00024779, partial [Nothophytophthora sp. Chile5]